jgi:TPR repeat protein
MFKEPDLAEAAMRAASTQCVLADPWRSLANLYNDSGQWKQALEALEKYRAIEPDEAWAIRRQAYAHERLANWSVALPLFKEAADKGDSYAQNAYGWQLYEGTHVPRDLDAAIKWFRLAADRGDDNARVNLARALREQAAARP